MKFVGRVSFRSSVGSHNGVLGEREIQSLNPQRGEKILEVTGWGVLEPGSLNLIVAEPDFEELLNMETSWIEDAVTVRYPKGLEHIPEQREAYYYYRASVSYRGETQDCLVRRAKVPPYPGCVELFAPVKLVAIFGLEAGGGGFP